MAFEKARGLLTKIQQPAVDRMSGVDPAVLSWISVLFAAACCYLLATPGVMMQVPGGCSARS